MFGDDVAWANNVQGAEETDIESGAHNESEQRLRQVKKIIKVVWNDLTWYSGDVFYFIIFYGVSCQNWFVS